jgi:hypothetical protein
VALHAGAPSSGGSLAVDLGPIITWSQEGWIPCLG